MNVVLINAELDAILDEMEVLPYIHAMESPAAQRYHQRRVAELRRSVTDLQQVIEIHQQETGEIQVESTYLKLAVVLAAYPKTPG